MKSELLTVLTHEGWRHPSFLNSNSNREECFERRWTEHKFSGFTGRTPSEPLARPSRPKGTLLLRRAALPATGVLPNAENVLHNAKSKAEATNFQKHWGGLRGLSYLLASVWASCSFLSFLSEMQRHQASMAYAELSLSLNSAVGFSRQKQPTTSGKRWFQNQTKVSVRVGETWSHEPNGWAK